MCLGIPGRVVETYKDHGILMGKVDFDGVMKRVCLAHVPEVQPGEYVLVHVGFALSHIDEAEARRVFAFLDGIEGHLRFARGEVLARDWLRQIKPLGERESHQGNRPAPFRRSSNSDDCSSGLPGSTSGS